MTRREDDFAALPLELKHLVNDVCQHVEAALRTGHTPCVEHYLGALTEPARTLLARELLVLECEHALRAGGAVDAAGLRARYGVSDELLAECQAEAGDGWERESDAPGLPSFGRYRGLRHLGSGAFASVFLAHDPRSRDEVAVKVPHFPAQFSEVMRERFLKEARATAALDHPNLARLLEVGEDGPVCFLVTEYVPGGSLADWMKRQPDEGRPVPPRLAAEWARTVAAAIHHAHERGVVHCDLTPGNVLLRDGRLVAPVVTDFGLAKLLGEYTHSLSGEIVGSPAYMAPEQARGRRGDVTAATDVYALGAILYHLLVGQPPFTGKDPVDLLHRVATDEPARPSALRADVPAGLEAVCLQCLEKDPRRRYATAAALADDLGRWLRGERVAARPAGLFERLWRRCRRHPLAAVLAGCLVATALPAAVTLVYQWRSAAALARNEEAARALAADHLATAKVLVAELGQVSQLPATPEFDGPRKQHREALIKTAAGCRRLLEDPAAGPEIRETLAEVTDGLSGLQYYFGEVDQALAAAQETVAQRDHLAAAEPANARHALGLIKAHRRLANLHSLRGDSSRAMASFRSAHALMQDYLGTCGMSPLLDAINLEAEFSTCLGRLPNVIDAAAVMGRRREVLVGLLREGRPDPILRYQLAEACHSLGSLLEDSSRRDEARASWREACDIYRGLLQEQPRSVAFRTALGVSCAHLARTGPGGRGPEYDEAARLFEAVGQDLSRLVEGDSSTRERLWDVGEVYYKLARCHLGATNPRPALEAGLASVRWREELVRVHPDNPAYASPLLSSLSLVARAQAELGLAADAEATGRRLSAGIAQMANVPPTNRTLRLAVATRLAYELCYHLRAGNRYALALQAAESSRRLFQGLLDEDPDNVSYLVGLGEAWYQIAKSKWPAGDFDQVLEACRQSIDLARKLFEKSPHLRHYRILFDDRLFRREKALRNAGRFPEVLDSILEREKLWSDDPTRLRGIADSLLKLANEKGDETRKTPPPPADLKQRCHTEIARVNRKADALERQGRAPGR